MSSQISLLSKRGLTKLDRKASDFVAVLFLPCLLRLGASFRENYLSVFFSLKADLQNWGANSWSWSERPVSFQACIMNAKTHTSDSWLKLYNIFANLLAALSSHEWFITISGIQNQWECCIFNRKKNSTSISELGKGKCM